MILQDLRVGFAAGARRFWRTVSICSDTTGPSTLAGFGVVLVPYAVLVLSPTDGRVSPPARRLLGVAAVVAMEGLGDAARVLLLVARVVRRVDMVLGYVRRK